MVVDDDAAFRRDVCAALAEAGVPVVAAGDGRDALAYLRGAALKPGLLVVDLFMPGMDGFSLLSALSAEPSLSTIPIIVLSGVSTRLLPREPVARFTKPMLPDELLAAVHRHALL